MGHSVVFWSPASGQTGTTTNLIAAASLLGLEYSARLLVLGHLQSRRAPLEQAYMRRRVPAEGDLAVAADTGIDALLRLAHNRKLQSRSIRDYTVPLLKDRLDLLPGSNKADKAFISSAKDLLSPLLETVKRYYDLVLIDGGSGTGSGWTQALLQQADTVVISLNQNRFLLDRFFHVAQSHPLLAGKRRLIVLGQYDGHSAMTAKNVARQYKLQSPVYPISHHSGWLDASQGGRAIDFLFRNRQAPRDHDNYAFMQHVRTLAQAIADAAAINKPFFGEKEG